MDTSWEDDDSVFSDDHTITSELKSCDDDVFAAPSYLRDDHMNGDVKWRGEFDMCHLTNNIVENHDYDMSSIIKKSNTDNDADDEDNNIPAAAGIKWNMKMQEGNISENVTDNKRKRKPTPWNSISDYMTSSSVEQCLLNMVAEQQNIGSQLKTTQMKLHAVENHCHTIRDLLPRCMNETKKNPLMIITFIWGACFGAAVGTMLMKYK